MLFRSRHSGFTLLVAMVITGLLAGYVAPKYFGHIGKSEVNVARAQLDALDKALDQYRLDSGHYPAASQGLNALMKQPSNEPRWAGPRLKKDVPLDPWGTAYQDQLPGKHGEFDLYYYGKDGQPAGNGEAADIANW